MKTKYALIIDGQVTEVNIDVFYKYVPSTQYHRIEISHFPRIKEQLFVLTSHNFTLTEKTDD